MDLDGIREVRLLRKQITWGTWRMVQVEPGEAERRSSCNRRMTAEELETISGTESRTASESLGESCCTGEHITTRESTVTVLQGMRSRICGWGCNRPPGSDHRGVEGWVEARPSRSHIKRVSAGGNLAGWGIMDTRIGISLRASRFSLFSSLGQCRCSLAYHTVL